MIKKLIHFLYVLLILALIIGVPAMWMIRRSYSDPEVHYYYTKENWENKENSISEENSESEENSKGIENSENTKNSENAKNSESAENKEKAGTESLRFIVISDLYGYVFEGGNGVIADMVSNTFPDCILVGGNMINGEAEEITETTDLIRRLSQIAPVFYSYGEQERKYVSAHSGDDPFGNQKGDTTSGASSDPLREALEKAGAVVLSGEYRDIQLYGIGVRIGGMYGNAYELTNLKGDVKKNSEEIWNLLNRFQDTDRLKIMLSIRPESFIYSDACDKWDIDLVVSGNLLGGLVVLPKYGGVFGNSQGYFPEYVHGLYEKGDVKIFITSGLSAPKGTIPRFNNPPEIAVIDIDGLSRAKAD